MRPRRLFDLAGLLLALALFALLAWAATLGPLHEVLVRDVGGAR